jgi:hypothetical protein
MDAATPTLRDIFYQYKDDAGGQFFDAIEKANTGGTYIFLFHKIKIEIVYNTLNSLDSTLDAFGSLDNCDVQFIYRTSLTISVVGILINSTTPAFWANHLSTFKPHDMPAEIDMK